MLTPVRGLTSTSALLRWDELTVPAVGQREQRIVNSCAALGPTDVQAPSRSQSARKAPAVLSTGPMQPRISAQLRVTPCKKAPNKCNRCRQPRAALVARRRAIYQGIPRWERRDTPGSADSLRSATFRRIDASGTASRLAKNGRLASCLGRTYVTDSNL